MIFSIYNTEPTSPINLQGTIIPPAMTHKDLGIYLDPRLSYLHHVEYLINNLRKKIFFTKRFLRNINNSHVLYMWFFAMFIPIISYGISVYASAAPSYLNKLKRSYNNAIRTIQQITSINSDVNINASCNATLLPTFESICHNQDFQLLNKYIYRVIFQ